MTVNRDLTKLFNHLDGWFTEISLNEPISHFALDEDRTKLELISRTTSGWFEPLTNLLTNEGIGDDNSDCETLDTLAKDLELLLEREDTEYYQHYFYNSNEELALLDDSTGHCCTTTTSLPTKKDDFNIVVQPTSDARYERRKEDLKIQASMPPDHDYLPRPRSKPLVLSNKLIQGFRNRQRESVLNTEAIKRFAKFSREFSVLSTKHDFLI